MADRPIIFSAPMVQSLLAGRKTQTRRIIQPEPDGSRTSEGSTLIHEGVDGSDFHRKVVAHFRPRFQRGDRLWGRENCAAFEQSSGEDGVHYPADEAWHPIQAGSRSAADEWLTLYHYGRKRGAVVPSIYMPRWASRLTLDVTDVRVERLQDISEEDARAEGTEGMPTWSHHRNGFNAIWVDIHGAEGWAANPWVAAISFTVHHANIDAPRSAQLLDGVEHNGMPEMEHV